jgi:hypothetical protein
MTAILATEMLITTVGWRVYRLTASELNSSLVRFAWLFLQPRKVDTLQPVELIRNYRDAPPRRG